MNKYLHLHKPKRMTKSDQSCKFCEIRMKKSDLYGSYTQAVDENRKT